MNNGLTGIKNLIWALAIVLVLAVVLVGLIITMVLGFSGQRQDGTLYLGESSGFSSMMHQGQCISAAPRQC